MIRLRARYRPSLLLLIAMASGCAKSSTPHSGNRPVPADRILDFATLYGQNCAGCHGADGQFGPAPPLDDPLFLAIVPDAVLSEIVAKGRPGTPMPAFSRKHGGQLTDEQVTAIARGIKQRWKPGRPEVPPPAYLLAEGRGKGDRERGEDIFMRSCAMCHGEEGRGGEDMVGPIHDPSFLALISDQAIRRIVITGRRDLKMPDFTGKDGRAKDFKPLTSTDVADLVEYLSGWRAKDDARRTE